MKSIALFWMVLLCVGASYSQLVEGEIDHNFVGSHSDTVVNSIRYAYYENPASEVQLSVNAKIQDHLKDWWKEGRAEMELSRSLFEELIATFEGDFIASEGEDYSILWELEIDMQIEEFENTVQLTVNEWAYSGGAHGNGAYTAWVFDKKSGKELSISDFFKDEEKVSAIFENVFRKQAGIAPDISLEEAGYWFEDNVFALNSNFYFSGLSMYVYFNTYEITDYATGPTELEVPFHVLGSLMIREL